MSNRNKIVGIAGIAVAALALIGVGVGATFNDSVAGAQTVSTGTLNVTIAPKTAADGAQVNSKTVQFTAAGPEGSVFSTTPESVVITNSGTITANAIRMTLTDSNSANDAALLAGLTVKVDSCSPTCGAQNATPVNVYTGTVNQYLNYVQAVAGTLAPGATDGFTLSFSTTNQTTGLDDTAQGEHADFKLTLDYVG